MITLSEYNIDESDNRGTDYTIVHLRTGEIIQVSIDTCIELITNMIENNPEVRDDFRHWDEDMKRRNKTLYERR